MSGLFAWSPNLVVLVGGVVFSWGLVRLAAFAPIVDLPNRRSSHRAPTPRTGGLALAAAVWAIIALLRWSVDDPGAAEAADLIGREIGFIALSASALGLGLADDLRLLGYRGKFFGQLALAVLFVVFVGALESFPVPGFAEPVSLHPLAGATITALWILGFVNVFNFMDGLDGMAGGSALIASGFLAAFGAAMSAPFVVAVGAACAAASLGFLIDNARGRIFLGDAGSHFLGFALAGLVVVAARDDPTGLNPLVGGVLFAPLLLDSAATLIRRAMHGEPIYRAHRDHLYQRLHQAGWSHLQVSALYAASTAGCGVAAWIARDAAPDIGWAVVLGVSAVLLGLGFGLDRAISAPDRR